MKLNLQKGIRVKTKKGTLTFAFVIAVVLTIICLSILNLMVYTITTENTTVNGMQQINDINNIGEYCRKSVTNAVDEQWVEELDSGMILEAFKNSIPEDITAQRVIALENNNLSSGAISFTAYFTDSGQTYSYQIKNLKIVEELYGYETVTNWYGGTSQVPVYKDKMYKEGYTFGIIAK